MMGEETFKAYRAHLKQNFDLDVDTRPVAKTFRFRNDGLATALFEAELPIAVQDCFDGRVACGFLRVAVVPGEAPLLLSKHVLRIWILCFTPRWDICGPGGCR